MNIFDLFNCCGPRNHEVRQPLLAHPALAPAAQLPVQVIDSPLFKLPDEVLRIIISYAGKYAHMPLLFTCKKLNRLTSEVPHPIAPKEYSEKMVKVLFAIHSLAAINNLKPQFSTEFVKWAINHGKVPRVVLEDFSTKKIPVNQKIEPINRYYLNK